MTLAQLRQKYLASLPDLDADILLQLSCNKDRAFIHAHPEYSLGFFQFLKLLFLILQRKRGVPIAYLTGHKEFFGLDFLVSRHTLIPRPDTELLVNNAIEKIKETDGEIILVDVGTGTGCIPISILKNIQKPIQTIAVDISASTLKVAQKNAERHGANIEFVKSDLIKKIKNFPELKSKKLFVTANLPYLTLHQFRSEASIQKEPILALVAPEEGLFFYRHLLLELKALSIPFTAFLEIDPQQTNLIKDLVYAVFPKVFFEIKNDLAGRDRLVIITVN